MPEVALAPCLATAQDPRELILSPLLTMCPTVCATTYISVHMLSVDMLSVHITEICGHALCAQASVYVPCRRGSPGEGDSGHPAGCDPRRSHPAGSCTWAGGGGGLGAVPAHAQVRPCCWQRKSVLRLHLAEFKAAVNVWLLVW